MCLSMRTHLGHVCVSVLLVFLQRPHPRCSPLWQAPELGRAGGRVQVLPRVQWTARHLLRCFLDSRSPRPLPHPFPLLRIDGLVWWAPAQWRQGHCFSTARHSITADCLLVAINVTQGRKVTHSPTFRQPCFMQLLPQRPLQEISSGALSCLLSCLPRLLQKTLECSLPISGFASPPATTYYVRMRSPVFLFWLSLDDWNDPPRVPQFSLLSKFVL